jgi:hypothetical protein
VNKSLLSVGKLYTPFLVAIAAILAAILINNTGIPPRLKVVPFHVDLVQLDIPISNIVLLRIGLICVAFIALARMAFIDYSKLYPHTLVMEVFFDPEGVERTLARLSQGERERLGIPENYKNFQKIYYEGLDRELEKVLGERVVFEEGYRDIHSEGDAKFVVEKVDGFQRYHLKESGGQLSHTLERPGQPPLEFMTFFEKRNSAYDYFQPESIGSLLLGRGILIRPMFNQILAENMRTRGKVCHHTIIGATKVYLYPFPCYSNTLYLAEIAQAGIIPIAYAVYR